MLQKREIASGICVVLLGASACTAAGQSEAAPAPLSPSAGLPTAHRYATPQGYQCVAGKYLTPGFASTNDYFTVNADWYAYVSNAYPGPEARGQRCFSASAQAAAYNLHSVLGYTPLAWAD